MKEKSTQNLVYKLKSFIPQEYIATCYTLYCDPDENKTHYTYDKTNNWYVETSGEERTHGYCMNHETIYNNLSKAMTGVDPERSITQLLLNINGTSGNKNTYTKVTTETYYPTLKELLDKNGGKIEAYRIEHDPHHPNTTGSQANWYHYGHVSKLSSFS